MFSTSPIFGVEYEFEGGPNSLDHPASAQESQLEEADEVIDKDHKSDAFALYCVDGAKVGGRSQSGWVGGVESGQSQSGWVGRVKSGWVGGVKGSGCVACSDSHVSKCLLLDLTMSCRLLVEDLSIARSWGWPLRSSPVM